MSPRTLLRLEGVLVPPKAVAQSAYLAVGAPGRAERAARLGGLALGLPALGLLGLADRRRQRRWASLALAGLGEDRIEVLAREFAERFLVGRLAPDGLALLERARAEGRPSLLLSHGLRAAVEPVCAGLEVEGVHAAELELRDGQATGKLLEPDVEALLEALRGRGVNLEASYGYGSDAADRGWLAEVGYPCAVNPDRELRRAALAAGWPIVEYEFPRA
ncbi:MAG: haloacid dehalogenase-like hydrolase [Planctomycetota bacterium]